MAQSAFAVNKSKFHKLARGYAKKGIAVFPCLPNEKAPLSKHGFWDATTDLAQIDAWWTEYPSANIGAPIYQSGLSVVDVDGEEGLAAWTRLQDESWEATPPTRTVRTPRGGLHLYFQDPDHRLQTTRWAKNAKRALGEHIDTRGPGSYVLLPGSRTADGEYVLEDDREPAPLPGWIPAFIPRRTAASKAPDGLELDMRVNLYFTQQRLQALARAGDVAIEGEGGGNRTYQAFTDLGDYGISSERAVELASEYWNPACKPEWEPADLQRIAEHAYRYRENELGCKARLPGSIVFKHVLDSRTEEAKERAAGVQSGLLTLSQIMELPDPEPLVEGMLFRHENGALAGEPKAGKTWVALDLALSIACDTPAFGVLPIACSGPVVYLTGEGQTGFKRRILAWMKHRGIDAATVERNFFLKCSVPLTRDGADETRAYIEGIRQRVGGSPVLVVIDTLARAMLGLDENAAKDAGLYLEMTEAMCREMNCTFLTCAHTGKKADAGIRGSGAFTGGLDYVWTVEKVGRQITVAPAALKDADMDKLGPYVLRLETVTVDGLRDGVDPEGAALVCLESDKMAKAKVATRPTFKKYSREWFVVMLRQHGLVGKANAQPLATVAERLAGERPKPRHLPGQKDHRGQPIVNPDFATWNNERAKIKKALESGKRIRGKQKQATLHGLFEDLLLNPGTEISDATWTCYFLPDNASEGAFC